MRRPITSLWVQTHPNVLIPKSLGKKNILWEEVYKAFWDLSTAGVHVLCGCGDLRRSGLINVFFWEEVVELVVNLATPLVICKFKFV